MKKFLLGLCFGAAFLASQAQVTYVNKNASGLNDGSSWTDAYTDLQTAIGNTASGEIWVAAGTYYPGTPGQNSATFTLKNNVGIIGGFNGTETSNTQRNPLTNICILSGDLDQSNSPGSADAYHVVSGGNADNTAWLDGFTITRGNAVGSGYDDRGAGLFFHTTTSGAYTPAVYRCIITMNTSAGDGAGMYIACDLGGGNTTGANIYNSTFCFNSAGGYGGAIYASAYGTLTFCVPTIENCIFYSNGGGISSNHIGAVNSSNGEVHFSLISCTLYGAGGGQDISYNANGINGSFSMSNSTMFGLNLYTDASFDANYCNGTPTYFTGTGNINTDPLFMNEGSNDFHLRCSSPMIDAGSAAYPVLTVDFEDNPRAQGGAPDIGAYETNYTIPMVVANATNASVCNGNITTLYGSGTPGVSYSWTGGVIDNSPFVPLFTDTYTVTATDAFYCSNTMTITVTVNPLPIVIANTDDADSSMCEGQMVTLYGSGDAVSYTWDNGVMDGVPFSSSASNTTFNVTGTSAAGCNYTSSITLTIAAATVYAGGDLNGCANEATGITVSGTVTGASSIMWNSTGGGVFAVPTDQLTFYDASAAEISAGQSMLYLTMIPASPLCATMTDTMIIFLHTPPTFSLGADYTICETDSIALQTTITGGSGGLLYNWSNGLGTISTANNEMYQPLSTENISLYVTDMYGCYGKDTVLVTVDASEMLSGTLYAGAGLLTDGTMYMMKYLAQQQTFDTLFTLPFSGGPGTFSFASFPHGNYLLKIVPDTILFPTFLPTYYGDAFQWDSATVISHNCLNPFTADIHMIQLLGGSGSGSISGYVLEDVGFGQRYSSGGHHDHVLVPGGPLKGIDVKLGKNPAGGIQARTMTDTTGHYAFEDLPNDSYRIYVDIPGLPMDSFYIVTINTATDTAINLNYYADSNSVYPILPTAVGLPSHKYVTENFDVYPNPARNYTSLRFEVADQSTATICLLDLTGKTILTTQLRNLPKGKHEYQLNFEDRDLKSGIYFIEVKSGEGVQVKKLVIE